MTLSLKEGGFPAFPGCKREITGIFNLSALLINAKRFLFYG